ncbi:MAG: DsbA oxidoreductase [Mycobacterium sp.]|nr:DsbA oxidoreductase [Mycobacterium sp.]
MSQRITRISILIIAAVIAVAAVLVWRAQTAPPPGPAEAGGNPALVRADSHRLTDAPDSRVTVVEFLDFECEACRAAYPAVEQLRSDYADQVTFVFRYFPISSHFNAELAATAVEAASRQGRLEPMYRLMFETQPEWGEQQVSAREVFVGFASRLGLDRAQFERDLDDPATLARVLADRQDGVELGVRGTPTFFVNGTPFNGVPDLEGLDTAIREELATGP